MKTHLEVQYKGASRLVVCVETVLLLLVLCTGCSFRYFKYSSCNTIDNLLFATAYA